MNTSHIDRQRQLQRQYLKGYQEHPETPEEIALAESTAQQTMMLLDREQG